MIGFLAAIAGVSGLAGKVQKIVKKIRKRIDKAIDRILMKIKTTIKGKRKSRPKKQAAEKAGLRTLHNEEKKYLKNNKITKGNAIKSAKTAKSKHPIFKSLTVVDGGKDWDYKYVIQKVEDGPEKEDDTPIKQEDIFISSSEVSEQNEWILKFKAKQTYLGRVEMLLTEEPKDPKDIQLYIFADKTAETLEIHPLQQNLRELLEEEAREAYGKTPTPGIREQQEISRADIFTKSKRTGDSVEVNLYAKVEKQHVWWGTSIIYLNRIDDGGKPISDSADFLLDATKKEIYADKVDRLRIKERTGFTKVAIEETNKVYRELKDDEDTEIPRLTAQLAEYNLLMFQIAYSKSKSKDLATESTPLAKGRMRAGYTELKTAIEKEAIVNLSEEAHRLASVAKPSIIAEAEKLGSQLVPTKVLVDADKPTK